MKLLLIANGFWNLSRIRVILMVEQTHMNHSFLLWSWCSTSKRCWKTDSVLAGSFPCHISFLFPLLGLWYEKRQLPSLEYRSRFCLQKGWNDRNRLHLIDPGGGSGGPVFGSLTLVVIGVAVRRCFIQHQAGVMMNSPVPSLTFQNHEGRWTDTLFGIGSMTSKYQGLMYKHWSDNYRR